MELTIFLILTALAALAGVANGLSQRDRTQGTAGAGAAALSGALGGVLLFWVLAGGVFLIFLALSAL